MNLFKQLQLKLSRDNAIRIRDFIVQNPQHLDALMAYYFHSDDAISQRASYAVSHIWDLDPELVRPFISKMIHALVHDELNTAQKRNITRTLQSVAEPKIESRLLDCLYDLLRDSKETIAIRVNSMSAIHYRVKNSPDLLRELHLNLKFILENEQVSAGMLARIRRILTD